MENLQSPEEAARALPVFGACRVIQRILLSIIVVITPWIFVWSVLHFSYTRKVSHVIVEPFRDYFSEIYNAILWAFSLLLCFSQMVDVVVKGRNRYYAASVCSFLFCIGYIGARDSRKELQENRRVIQENRNESRENRQTLQQLKIDLDQIPNKISPKRYKFKKEDFSFYWNTKPLFVKGMPMPINLRFGPGENVSLSIQNMTKTKTISDFILHFTMIGCDIRSDAPEWKVDSAYYKGSQYKILTYYNLAKISRPPLTPGYGKILPDVEISCLPTEESEVRISLNLDDAAPLEYPMAFKVLKINN